MEKKRFTLRQEYFGGIIHDSTTMTTDILSPKVYELLADLSAGGNEIIGDLANLSNEEKKELSALIEKKIISKSGEKYQANSLRKITGTKIPSNCLTAPLRVYHAITRKCNLRCNQCCVGSFSDFQENRLTTDQIKKVMDMFYNVGTMEWRFTGGEPTSCSDLFELISYAKETLGMAVMLNTNGCWDDEMTNQILVAKLDEIIISLEGRENVNDQRRSPGVFQKIIKALQTISSYNQSFPEKKIRTTVNMTIAKDNVSELEYVIRLAANYGFNVNFVPLRPYGRTLEKMLDKMLTTKEFMEFSDNVQKMREDPEIMASKIKIIHRNMDLFCPDYPDKSQLPYPFHYGECGALATGFGICPDGKVNACSFLMDDPEFLGPNLLMCSVQGAWLSQSMEHFRTIKVGCNNCRFYHHQCEGKCRAMVLANGGIIKDGKLFGHDPYCFSSLMKNDKKRD